MHKFAALILVLSGFAYGQEQGHASYADTQTAQQAGEQIQRQPATTVNSQEKRAGDAPAVNRAKDDCVGPPSFCRTYFGGS